MRITATCSNPRPSTCCDTPGAIDLDVKVILEDGIVLQHGELTFVRGFDGKMTPYAGQPDHWIDGQLLRSLRILSAPGSRYELDFDAALAELQRAALAVMIAPTPRFDPDVQCPTHGCARWRCDADH